MWVCSVKPLTEELLIPVGDSLAPVYHAISSLYNIYIRFWRNLAIYAALRLPQCSDWRPLISTIFDGTVPIARTVKLLVTGEIMSLASIEVPANHTQLAAAIFFDYGADFTAALSGFSACYCTPIGYIFDVGTLLAINAPLRCAVANAVSFIFEAQRLIVEFLVGGIDFIGRLILWLMCSFFRTCSGSEWDEFPISDVLPIFDKLAHHTETVLCCVGDLIDDITAVVMDVVEYILQQTFFPSEYGAQVPLTGHIKVGGLFRAAPVAIETSLDLWKIFRSLAIGTGVSGAGVDAHRLFDYYESACAECAGTVEDLGAIAQRSVMAGVFGGGILYVEFRYPGAGIRIEQAWKTTWDAGATVTSTATSALVGIPLPLTYVPNPPLWATVAAVSFVIGPRVANHTCQVSVRLMRMIYDIATEVESYDDYVNGNYFNCVFGELENIITVIEEDINEVSDLMPAWRTCSAVDDEAYICVPFTGVCSTKVRCTERMFPNGELGKLAAAPAKILLAATEYAEEISRNLYGFDEVRRVRSDCIFDHVNELITASTGVTRAILVALPLGPW